MRALYDKAFRFIQDDALVITRPGLRLRKREACLIVMEKDRVLDEVPFFRIKSLTLARGLSLSTDVLEALGAAEIEVLFVDGVGRPFGSFIGTGHLRSARLRREQYAAAGDERGAYLARVFALAKVRNQARLLVYFTRNEKDEAVVAPLEHLRDAAGRLDALAGANAAEVRLKVMGIEGAAARAYWEAVQSLLAGRAEFAGRTGHGAEDSVNACLNYGYAVLFGEIWRALLRAGLDPYAGFLHADRDGQTALVFDLAEEFRQPLVDRAIIASLRRRWQPVADEAGRLDLESRRHVLEIVKENLDRDNYAVTNLIAVQARALAGYLREGTVYQPVGERWW